MASAALTNVERQRRHRQAIAQKLVTMETALRDVIAKLGERSTPLANEIREIALRGLNGDAA